MEMDGDGVTRTFYNNNCVSPKLPQLQDRNRSHAFHWTLNINAWTWWMRGPILAAFSRDIETLCPNAKELLETPAPRNFQSKYSSPVIHSLANLSQTKKNIEQPGEWLNTAIPRHFPSFSCWKYICKRDNYEKRVHVVFGKRLVVVLSMILAKERPAARQCHVQEGLWRSKYGTNQSGILAWQDRAPATASICGYIKRWAFRIFTKLVISNMEATPH